MILSVFWPDHYVVEYSQNMTVGLPALLLSMSGDPWLFINELTSSVSLGLKMFSKVSALLVCLLFCVVCGEDKSGWTGLDLDRWKYGARSKMYCQTT